jgi:tryptophan 2,3-dioxygenase
MNETTPTYWDYLDLPTLLNAQSGLGDGDIGPDELHFIIVHQAYELWFKLVLSQVRLARDHLVLPEVPEEAVPEVVHNINRVNEIMRLAVDQMKVMETLTPLDFLDFRDKLVPSSGFQSFQMRELEILLGLEEAQRLHYGKVNPLTHIQKLAETSPGGAMAWGRIEAARKEVSLREALHRWLYRTPIQGSTPDMEGDEEVVMEFLQAYLDLGAESRNIQADRLAALSDDPAAVRARFAGMAESARAFMMAEDIEGSEAKTNRIRRIRAALLFVESDRELPLLAWPRLLVDTVVELEEQIVIWRHRHARMVERLIGRRVGTGGSAGVAYLDKTTAYRVFPELWAVRSMLSPRRARPEVKNAELYAFGETVGKR